MEAEIRCFVKRNGAKAYLKQCLCCGAKASQEISRQFVLAKGVPRAWDAELEERGRRAITQELDRRRLDKQRQQDERRGEWWDKLQERYQEPDWQELRRLVFERAKGMCEGCGRRRATQVHHRTYEHLGEEFLWELAAVCQECHERVHGRKLG